MLYYTQIIKTKEIINELINDISYQFIQNCCSVMIKHINERTDTYFSATNLWYLSIFFLKFRLKHIDNMLSMCLMFFSIGYFIYPTWNWNITLFPPIILFDKYFEQKTYFQLPYYQWRSFIRMIFSFFNDSLNFGMYPKK